MKFKLSANLSGKLDAKKGTIRDVSIISEGPALGHGVGIDTKTLSGLWNLTKGNVVKAYWTHGGPFSGDRLGEEVGLFSGFFIDTAAKQLKANFQALESFKAVYPERFAYLFELASKAPDNFGVSIHFAGDAVWILDTGAEVPADGEKPANALGEMPVVRVSEIFSADFVSEPAANAGGLFAQGKLTELLDLKQKLSAEIEQATASLSASNEKQKETEAARAELSAKLDEASKAIETERAAFAVKESEFSAVKAQLDAQVSDLSAKLTAANAEIEAGKTAAATAESEYKAQLAAMQNTLVQFGATPVNIYSEVIDHAATFAGIKDPVARARYWKQHKDAIMAN